MISRQRRALTLLLGVGIAVGAWLGWRGYVRYRSATDLKAAKKALDYGDTPEARRLLERAAAWEPGQGEVEFLLGAMEMAVGKLGEADARWALVPADSPFAPNAAMFRARLVLRTDQFAPAEDLLRVAIRGRGPLALEARQTLLNLFKIEGRFNEALRVLLDGWDQFPASGQRFRELEILSSGDPMSVIKTRQALESADRNAPGDDRIMLGWGNYNVRTGRLDEAKAKFDACLKLRPDDPAVWQGWLNWAQLRQDPVEVARAVRHLPVDFLTPVDVLTMQAGFAALAGDRDRERAAYEAILARDPGVPKALDRLADLAAQAGQADLAARYHARRVDVGKAREAYTARVAQNATQDDPAGSAALAETLGRWFEASLLWGKALEKDPNDVQARAGAARSVAAEQQVPVGPTLADLVADLDAHPPAQASANLGSEASRRATTAEEPTPAPIRFSDRAPSAGLNFQFVNGTSAERQLPETSAGGVGLLDYDGDGWLDVYLTQGEAALPRAGQPPTGTGDRLFRNRRDGTFEDATATSGLAAFASGYGHGVAVGDADGDGRPDLFVTRWGRYSLYRNRGDGTFEDRTDVAGLGGDRGWPTSAVLADLDGDGDQDLYVCHYARWDPAHPMICTNASVGRPTYCAPFEVPSQPDHLFRNDGGRFVDVTDAAGIVDRNGRGLGVVAADLDGDNKLDLFVADDGSANLAFRNLGGMKFEEFGLASGLATDGEGNTQASMGVAAADYNDDGLIDLAKTNFFNESVTLYENRGAGQFADVTVALGLAAPTRFMLGFGMTFLDADNDGWPDLATTNGHVEDFRPEFPWQMPNQILRNLQGRRFADVSKAAGADWNRPQLGRALAAGDIDNDGRVDLVILAHDAPVSYLHNDTEGGSYLTVTLEPAQTGRDTTGARVTVTAAGRTRSAWQFGGGSFQSASDRRIHFGLGAAPLVDQVEVRWPSGRADRYGSIPAGRHVTMREGQTTPRNVAINERVSLPEDRP